MLSTLLLSISDTLIANKPLADLLVVTLLPALATLISGWLSHDGWKDWVNGLIVYGVVILLSAGYALLAGQLVSDWLADTAIIAGIVAAFMSDPLIFKPLYNQFVAKLPSPIAAIINAIADALRPYDPHEAVITPPVLRASRPSSPTTDKNATSPLPDQDQPPVV